MHKEMKMLTAGKWNQLKARQRDIEKVPEREGEEGQGGNESVVRLCACA